MTRPILLALALTILPAVAYPQTPVTQPSTSTSFLRVDLGNGWTLAPNVSIVAFAYDFTRHNFLGQVTFTGLYILDYSGLIGVGLGGSVVLANPFGLTVATALVSPSLPIGGGASIRAGLIGQYAWLGPSHDFQLAIAPTITY